MTEVLARDPAADADPLAVAVACCRMADQAERDLLLAAVEYAAQHPAPGVSEEESFYGDRPLELAGSGAPGVSEFAVAEFAAALGMTPAAGKRFLGAALELAHRLPRVWARIEAGQVSAWKARMVAERTIGLSETAAGYVDAKVAAQADRIGPARLVRLVEEARLLSEEPETDTTLDRHAGRQVAIDTGSAAVYGVAYVDATLDAADALDLEQAVQTAAAQLKADGNDLPLDLRRSLAVGVIARDYLARHDTDPAEGTTVGTSVHLYVHYAPDSAHGRQGYAILDNTNGLTTLEQISQWLDRPGTSVKVTPVIDLAATLSSSGYTPGPRLREQVILRDRVCAFPGCTKTARSGDLDHIDPYQSLEQGGPPNQTRSTNLAAICRPHHRLKTFGDWTYRMLEPGYYLWRSPKGRHYLRTPTGTITLA